MMESNALIIGLNEIIRLLFAVFIGGLIGIERELHYKAAGFRTMMLICVGVRAVHHVLHSDRRTQRSGTDRRTDRDRSGLHRRRRDPA